jgi:hypothetical protein
MTRPSTETIAEAWMDGVFRSIEACCLVFVLTVGSVSQPLRLNSISAHSAYRADSRLTTPWIGCEPKCVVAGPVYTMLIFENETEDPPEMHT